MTLFAKYKQTILYLIFGVLSTIVNILTYTFCTRNLNIEFLISNWIAWIVAVLFAYITNKFFVFESKETNIKFLIKELSSFVSCRLLSGIIEMILMYTMISLMSLNDFIVKIITNVVVVILNFIFSKLIIFKNK
ncbi:GtrA family protein [Romboutsia timonensis]|uniref:GtrA family protein n=1 Tax=Romboutsia timonensis TaxID=1776391 RepID=UPI002A7F6481|nr:GtrA family protein [Romboutsia timonensis]MDY3960514.1 GtrA family protein [Romboutsia timonensis]